MNKITQPEFIKTYIGKASGINSAIAWCQENSTKLLADITNSGAILLRNFDIQTAEDFSNVIEAIGIKRTKYIGGNNPRQSVHDDKMYFSTSYPASWKITLHSEMSHLERAPAIVGFFAKNIRLDGGGETYLANSREILSHIPPELILEMKEKGITYTQRMRDARDGFGFGRTWQDVFESESPEFVEQFCATHDIKIEWEGRTLVAKFNRTPTISHPMLGNEIWFNQAEQWHNSNIDNSVREIIRTKLQGHFPHHCSYSNGDEFKLQDLESIREVYQRISHLHTWEKNDVLIVNNYTLAHGRAPYKGERELLFIMGNY